MDGQTIDIIVMIAYLACVVLIGYYSMNQIEDFDDYAVAGRSIPARSARHCAAAEPPSGVSPSCINRGSSSSWRS